MGNNTRIRRAGLASVVLAGVLGAGAIVGDAAFAASGQRDCSGTRTPVTARDGSGTAATARRGQAQRSATPTVTVAPAAATAELKAALDRAFADEVMALETYRAFLTAFGQVRPFVNLAASEARHVAALERVAAAVGVSLDRQTPTVVPASTKAEALAAAEAIERQDIALYDELIPQLGAWPSVVRVLTNLRTASVSHLAAVTR
jgi:hypothetical protein